jgi:hypothetical protein
MGIKKIKKLIKQEVLSSYQDGWNDGYDTGYEAANLLEQDPEKFSEGISAEQSRIQFILDTHIKWAMESGRGGEAITLSKIKEIIIPIKIDYSEEAYQESLEKDGF